MPFTAENVKLTVKCPLLALNEQDKIKRFLSSIIDTEKIEKNS
jgi:hypothetical protein